MCSRYFYWRQLRDMKGSALVEAMVAVGLTFYARICGWTLARAHARSGDPVAIAAYLGDDDAFDRSITDFSERYADQNEQDFQDFVEGRPIRPNRSPHRSLKTKRRRRTHATSRGRHPEPELRYTSTRVRARWSPRGEGVVRARAIRELGVRSAPQRVHCPLWTVCPRICPRSAVGWSR